MLPIVIALLSLAVAGAITAHLMTSRRTEQPQALITPAPVRSWTPGVLPAALTAPITPPRTDWDSSWVTHEDARVMRAEDRAYAMATQPARHALDVTV